jgi:hypothetical protein
MRRILKCGALSAIVALFPGAVLGQTSGRRVTFAGHTWIVKASSAKVGPGPNFFSDSADNVWVDDAGALHLKISKAGKRWNCAEVICERSFGYGNYRFELASRVDDFDPYVVLGLFTWNDDPAYTHRELDVEFSRWGNRNNLNAQYVVQPYTVAENIYRFDQPAESVSTHSFLWLSDSVRFLSRGASGQPIAEKSFSSGIPQAGGENPRINLWLFRGRAPSNRQPVEVVIRWFEFLAPQ